MKNKKLNKKSLIILGSILLILVTIVSALVFMACV